ncbi:MAG: amino acid adenylation domain-containing protein [bacterium]|nr:amino acid adenylation domain-containing protein [bacterium]
MQTSGNIQQIYPLTPMQGGMLFHALYEPHESTYFQQVSYRLSGKLDIDLLKKSLHILFERHEILRAAFIDKGKNPVQVILKKREPEIYYEDLQNRDLKDGVENYIREFKEKDKQRSFDLIRDVLLRISILCLGNNEYHVTWSYHHILMDGWSSGILISEFFELYNSFIGNRPHRLSQVKPFREYIQWLEKQDKEESKKFWKNYLQGYDEVARIPRLKPGGIDNNQYRREEYSVALDPENCRALNRLAVKNQVSLNTIVQSIWGILLSKYNRTRDVVYGTVVSGRPSEVKGVEATIGLFINTVPVRITYDRQTTFGKLLAGVQKNALDSEAHHFSPLAEVQAESSLKLHLIDHILAFENYPVAERIEGIVTQEKVDDSRGLDLTVTDVEIFEQTNYDFNVIISGEDQLHIAFNYNANVFMPDFIKRIAGHFQVLAQQLVPDETIPIHRLKLLEGMEKEQLLSRLNNNEVHYPNEKTIHRLFQEQVRKTPHAPAVDGPPVIAGEPGECLRLTYHALERRANRLAAVLRENGVNRGVLVSLLLDRSIEMVIAIIAVLKAGGGYLPIDPGFPTRRIQYILEDSRVKWTVTSRQVTVDLLCDAHNIYLEDIETHPLKDSPPRDDTIPTDLAYVIYTSGTTGKPKGALIEHKNVVRLLFNDGNLFDFSPGDVWTVFHSFSFDFSVWEMYGALLYGGRFIVIPKQVARDPGSYLEVLKTQQVTVLNQTPSAFYQLIEEELKHPAGDLSVRYVIFGGEALKPSKLKQWNQRYPKTKLINMFGITETTVHVTYKEITSHEIDFNISNIGTPIPTLSVFVSGRELELLPIGIAGELCVGGEGVARGYLNNPRLTWEKFIPNHYISSHNRNDQRLYRSGDLVRVLENGEMEYLGRIDHQVQVRGFRVELKEIESQLLKHPDLAEALVLAREDKGEDIYLCAYLVARKGYNLEVFRLKEYLSRNLPDYMVPAYFVFLESIPLTGNGKIDRGALPDPFSSIESGNYAAPVTAEEEELVSIWQDLLAMENIGTMDDFFMIGGDSIKAIRLLNQVNTRFDTHLKVVDIFENNTIRQLAAKVEPRDSLSPSIRDENQYQQEAALEIERLKQRLLDHPRMPGEVDDVYPMSDIQKGMVYHSNKNPSEALYHEQFLYQVKYSGFRIETFKKALGLLAGKHSILRTAFDTTNFEEFVQMVYPQVPIDLVYFDISDLEVPAQEGFIRDYLRSDRENPFDPSTPPLWRMILFGLGSDRLLSAWVFHHSILDGWSNASLMTELHNTYLELNADPAFLPVKLKHSYKDFVIEQLAERKKEETRDYWRRVLEGFTRLDFPGTSRDHPPNVKVIRRSLGTAYLESLREASGNYHSNVKNLCFAAFGSMLNMLSRNNDITVGLVTNNRPQCEDGDKIVGCFLNTIPFRLTLPPRLRWADYIRLVDDKLLRLKHFERISLFEILKIIGEKSQDNNPLFDVLFNYVDFHIYKDISPRDGALSSPGDEEVPDKQELSVSGFENTNTLFDFSVDTTFEQFNFTLKYSNSLLSDSDAQRLLGYFRQSLDLIIHQPGIPIEKEMLLSPGERDKLVLTLNESTGTVDYPRKKSIHHLFRDQVDRSQGSPAAQAVVFREESLDYRQLDRWSDATAVKLKEHGFTPGAIAAIMVEPSLEMIVGLLGILKAGGAYLPLDPGYPDDRINYMLADSAAKVLVTTGSLEKIKTLKWPCVQSKQPETILLDSLGSSDGLPPQAPSIPASSPDSPAYIIYTSGTTGRPKGVLIEHRNVVRLLFNDSPLFDFDSNDTWTLFHSFCFDFSVWEMYGALLYGGRLIVIPRMVSRDPSGYLEILKEQKVTVLNQTPSAFYNLTDQELASPGTDLGLRYVIFGGEALTPYKLKNWKKRYPKTKLINMFGITETTVHVTFKEITNHEIDLNIGNIGKPIPTLRCYILGEGLELLPPGVAGELCVGGEGVGRGYLNNPRLTADRFVPNPFVAGDRLYRSGDLVKLNSGDEMEYLGRIDHQVQVKGFRIELGEIESQLLRHGDVREAAVLANRDEEDNTYLCAYLVSGTELSVPTLRQYLSDKLPDYMVPSYFVPLERLPLTPNGKLDRKALPAPQVMAGIDYVAPKNEIQQTMVKIWQDVLDVEQVGITNKYFDIGGDSIKAIKLLSSINKTLNTSLMIVDLFTHESIEKLSERVNQVEIIAVDNKLTEAAEEVEALRVKVLSENNFPGYEGIEDIYPMSDIEKGMVFHSLKESGRSVYHDQMVHQVNYKNFDSHRFQKALTLMVEKHPILRTSFNISDFGESVQLVHKNPGVDYRHEEISQLGKPEQEEYIKRLLAEDRGIPLEINAAPLWRLRTFGINDENIVVFFTCHHAIIDGWSDASFNTELNNIYVRLKSDPGFVPDKLKSSYKDFVIEQMAEKKKIETVEYWKNELQDYKRFQLPLPVTRETGENEKPSMVLTKYSAYLGTALLEKLKGFAITFNTSVKHLCFAAYIYMLYMVSYENDLVVGLVTNNRPLSQDGEKILGCFLNTVPLRLNIPAKIKWSDYINLVEKKLITLTKYSKLPLHEIVDIIGEKTQDQNPIFDTLYNFIDFHIYQEFKGDNESRENPDRVDTNLSLSGQVETNTLLDVSISTTFDNFWISFSYRPAILSEERIKQLAHYFQSTLNKFVEKPGSTADKMDLISLEEQQKLLYDFNNTGTEYPKDKSINELFQTVVEKVPHKIAVVFEEHSVTYRELGQRSHELAGVLNQQGLNEDSPVGLLMERSLEMITGILAILKAGGAYLPIDPDYPMERIRYILRDSSVPLLLTTPGCPALEKVSPDNKIVYLDGEGSSPPLPHEDGGTGDTALPKATPFNIAYIIYTSGSTGNPKGVMVEHRNVVRLVKNTNYIDFRENHRILQTGAMEFDASTFELWGALLNGSSLFLLNKEKLVIAEPLKESIMKLQITAMWMTSPLFNQMVQSDIEIFSGIQNLLVGGDVLSPLHINRLRSRFPRLNVINGYGPTENTTFSTTHLINKTHNHSIPIGKPISNSTAYIMDRLYRLQPVTIPGELWVGGAGVSRGYQNDPELTAEKFISNETLFVSTTLPHPPSYLYKTGDMARLLFDGTIEFLGRLDEQVKIRGFRVELGEIENHLLKHEKIKEALVITRKDKDDNNFLCAYTVPAAGLPAQSNDPGKLLDETEVREYLLKKLPSYMVPPFYVELAEIPLTPNGKVDRGALPAPDIESGGDYSAPMDEVELKLTKIWSEVLGIDKKTISRESDFFRIGGHSLNATVLISKIHQLFEVKIPLSEVFTSPTIRELAQSVRQTEEEEYFSINAVESREYYELSSAQKRLYILHRMEPGDTGYNMPVTLTLEGDVSLEKLEQVFIKLINRHESFRTSFLMLKGRSIQKIHDKVEFAIQYYDFGTAPSAPDSTSLNDTANEIIQHFIRPFDLSRAPLIRVGIIKTGEHNNHILMIDMHHIITDGTSMALITRDFMSLYTGKELSEFRVQYKDFSEWQNNLIASGHMESQERYWLDRFKDGIPELVGLTDYPRLPEQSLEGEMVSFELGPGLTAKLKDLVLETGTSLFMVLTATYTILLSKYTNQDDIVVGAGISGRRHPDLENIIGMFVNMLVLQNQPSGNKSFIDFLGEVKENALAAFENQDYPFDQLVTELGIERQYNRNPIFDTQFTFQNVKNESLDIPDLVLKPYEYKNNITKFDLSLHGFESVDTIAMTFEYKTGLFKPSTIESMRDRYLEIIEQIIEKPAAKLEDIAAKHDLKSGVSEFTHSDGMDFGF